ncbi:MAG TPA: LysR family transcriptional regulator [Amaricoccus sp.]|nr:LysR family transcriptional regulator [Amaricoccus sp.]
MTRHLDMSALRSFTAVADSGGVTRASAQLNLTQSAVSMQLKRLETQLGLELFDRSGRSLLLTAQGEQLLAYSRRLLALNDEAWSRLTHPAFEGVIDFGVPHDIIYPHVPGVLQRFAAAYPRVKLQLHSLYTSGLKELLAKGEMDLILTTEGSLDPGGETLLREPLVWAGAPGGQAWKQRPLRYASCGHCVFKRPALEALEEAGIPWELAVDSISPAAVDASVAADLAVSVQMQSGVPAQCEAIRHGGALPELPDHCVNMYVGSGARTALAERLADIVRQAYGVADCLAAE